MERGELQRNLEATEVRLNREINRREVFERKNAELESLNESLRTENETMRLELETVKQELAEKTTTLERELKQRLDHPDSDDSSSTSSSSSDEDTSAYVNIPNTIETKILTLKRKKAALKQQLKAVNLSSQLSYEAAFQEEVDLRTNAEEKLDNLTKKYERLLEENDELRMVLQNHNIVVRPSPLSLERRDRPPHNRKNIVPKPPPSLKQWAQTFQSQHRRSCSKETPSISDDHSSLSSEDSTEEQDTKNRQSKLRNKKCPRRRPHTMPTQRLQVTTTRGDTDIVKNESEKPVGPVNLDFDHGQNEVDIKSRTADSEMRVKEGRELVVENLMNRSQKYLDSLKGSGKTAVNVGNEFEGSTVTDDTSKSQKSNVAVKSGQPDSSMHDSVKPHGQDTTKSVPLSLSQSSLSSLDQEDVHDSLEQFVVSEGPVGTTGDGDDVFYSDEVKLGLPVDFQSFMCSTEQQLESAKSFYQRVNQYLSIDNDSN